MDVNAYTNATGNSRVGTQTASTKKSNSNELDMNDFMKLLSAQLANQDVMNPMDNTAFIAQMAQFTSLQAMQTMSEITYASYGASMTGKNVLVSYVDAAGAYKEDTGVIESVVFAGGDCFVRVNGEEYTLSSVMEILEPEKSGINDVSYGASLIGKKVVVSTTDDEGVVSKVTGVVDSVILSDGKYMLKIGDKEYPLSSVVEIVDPSKEDPVEPPKEDPVDPVDPPEGGGETGGTDKPEDSGSTDPNVT